VNNFYSYFALLAVGHRPSVKFIAVQADLSTIFTNRLPQNNVLSNITN
jgi:hypothetical protein